MKESGRLLNRYVDVSVEQWALQTNPPMKVKEGNTWFASVLGENGKDPH